MPPTAITDILPKLCYDAGTLVAVEHALFEGDRPFVCGVCLSFEYFKFVFRASADDDTISVVRADSFLQDDEVAIDVTADQPWAGCVGRTVKWAWRMVNQQGYEDGIRLEFDSGTIGVDLVVVASAIRLYAFTAVA